MKTFHEFLGEMSLKHYRTDFKAPTDASKEGFSKNSDGSTNLSNQIKLDPVIGIMGRFSQKDKSILSHPKTFKTLEDKLGKSGHDFNILMMDREEPYPYQLQDGSKKLTKIEWFKKEAKELLEREGVPTEGRITFIKNSSSGNLMKPWMVLHTLAHAVFEENGFGFVRLEPNIQRETTRLTQDGTIPLGQIFMFSSASAPQAAPQEQGGLEGHEDPELQHELMAEFLWNGRIRIKGPDQEEAAENIQRSLEELLDNCVGKIIIHHGN